MLLFDSVFPPLRNLREGQRGASVHKALAGNEASSLIGNTEGTDSKPHARFRGNIPSMLIFLAVASGVVLRAKVNNPHFEFVAR